MFAASTAAKAAGSDGGFLAAKIVFVLASVPTPVFIGVTATMPWWHAPLRDWSEVAGLLGPILAVAVAVAKITMIMRHKTDEPKKASAAMSLVGASAAGVSITRRFQLVGLAVLAALGLVAAATYHMKREKVLAAPIQQPVPLPGPATVPKRKGATPKSKSDDDAGGDDVESDDATEGSEPKWLVMARAEVGVKEWKGRKHNPKIVAYFKDARHPGMKNDETPWCAAFVGAMLERCGVPSSGSLAARSYEKWGEACEPAVGCVVTLWRGSPTSWQGHVGFYVGGAGSGRIRILGGNQNDAVNIQSFPEHRVTSYRRPRKLSKSKTVRAQVMQAVATAGTATGGLIGAASAEMKEATGLLAQLGQHWRPLLAASLVLQLVLVLYTIKLRNDARKENGV